MNALSLYLYFSKFNAVGAQTYVGDRTLISSCYRAGSGLVLIERHG